MRAILLSIIAQLCLLECSNAFASTRHLSGPPFTTALLAGSNNDAPTSTTSRRQLISQSLATATIFTTTLALPAASFAKADPLEADKQKLVQGYKRLNYLLDNWEQETTNCKTKTQYSSAKNACERTPLKVQEYLGYRSTEDPLFRADKTMRRLEVLVPPDLEVEYLDAMERYNEKAEEGSGNSYTSSWGEANPGGGKDRVELFVERAKANVVDARDALGEVCRILNLV